MSTPFSNNRYTRSLCKTPNTTKTCTTPNPKTQTLNPTPRATNNNNNTKTSHHNHNRAKVRTIGDIVRSNNNPTTTPLLPNPKPNNPSAHLTMRTAINPTSSPQAYSGIQHTDPLRAQQQQRLGRGHRGCRTQGRSTRQQQGTSRSWRFRGGMRVGRGGGTIMGTILGQQVVEVEDLRARTKPTGLGIINIQDHGTRHARYPPPALLRLQRRLICLVSVCARVSVHGLGLDGSEDRVSSVGLIQQVWTCEAIANGVSIFSSLFQPYRMLVSWKRSKQRLLNCTRMLGMCRHLSYSGSQIHSTRKLLTHRRLPQPRSLPPPKHVHHLKLYRTIIHTSPGAT